MYAFVTGASSGIGREIARQLAQKGYDLILTARRVNRLEELKKEIVQLYNNTVQIVPCDLSEPDNCIKLWKKISAYPIEILVNAAGFGKVGSVRSVPIKEEIKMIRTNIMALHILTKYFIQDKKRGYILNIASIAGFQPGPMLSAYSASKAYVLNYSLAVNYELKMQKKPIHITTLCPGPVKTEFDQVAGTNFALRSISAKRCAKAGLKGLFRRKDVVIPGTGVKILRLGAKLAPYSWILPVEYRIQTRKLKQKIK